MARLHGLLESYYRELQESALILPTDEEIARRELAQRDAETLDNIPFSVDKVRLNGTEGSTALAEISKRLMDPRIPESRRDIAPIYIIKTRLFDTLVGSENRSLKPVGKNHYIARVRLQPGDTTISILSNQWEVHLPQQADARDYLITLYRPVDGTPELHVFAVDDLLAADKPHIPAWLPDELDIKTKRGMKRDNLPWRRCPASHTALERGRGARLGYLRRCVLLAGQWPRRKSPRVPAGQRPAAALAQPPAATFLYRRTGFRHRPQFPADLAGVAGTARRRVQTCITSRSRNTR